MIGITDTYYLRPEVSNSDLGELEKYFLPREQRGEIEAAYRFGNLIDAMITEPERCDHYSRTVDGVPFTKEEWELAYKMLKSFRADETCAAFLKLSEGQAVKSVTMDFNHNGVEFQLLVRCKFDLWMERMQHGADIKSTTATTQKQFEASIAYFNYDRQRAFYMDIAQALGYRCDRDMLIGISKVNQKIFKLPIKRGDEIYRRGRQKVDEVAFRWWSLFEGFKLP